MTSKGFHVLFYINLKTQRIGAFDGMGRSPATYLVWTVDGIAEWDAVDCAALD